MITSRSEWVNSRWLGQHAQPGLFDESCRFGLATQAVASMHSVTETEAIAGIGGSDEWADLACARR